MSNSLPIITITHQSGSRGRTAGKLLARQLKIPYYGYEILDLAASRSGLAPELFEGAERSARQMLDLLKQELPAGNLPVNVQAFLAKAETIRALAQQGPAVIVSQCADTILSGRSDIVNVYIYASESRRIKNTTYKKVMSEEMAKTFLHSADKNKSAYYLFFSTHRWDELSAYDLCVCTDQRTPEQTAEAISAFLAQRAEV